ncbi:MAG: orotate phosphoribosyltransferase [Proteobacteria bacterium]|nr:orotate phosphoribosyltransferase [Pseudomonadota bacterium]
MERTIARILMEMGAVTLRADPPFQWASGRFAPIYCDNRLVMSEPDKRIAVAEGFVRAIEARGWSPEVIAGTATAGIPHAAWVAHLMSLPMVYVRGAAKGHGKENRIEGRLEKGRRVVLIEDLISTGGSSLEAATALVEAGAALEGLAAIFTYGLPVAAKRLAEAGVDAIALSNFNALMEEALAQGALTAAQKAIIAEWQRDPGAWSKDRGGAP